MKVEVKMPDKIKYPYLAVWTNGELLSDEELKRNAQETIYIVSKVGEDVWILPFDDSIEPYITLCEYEYTALPIGFKVTLSN
jgi:hypothetical protein